MQTTRRTHICRITNHTQVADALDRHGWSASKLWNVANYYAQQQWDEAGEIPDESELKRELKTHPKYKGLHSQSSQKVLEELSEIPYCTLKISSTDGMGSTVLDLAPVDCAIL